MTVETDLENGIAKRTFCKAGVSNHNGANGGKGKRGTYLNGFSGRSLRSDHDKYATASVVERYLRLAIDWHRDLLIEPGKANRKQAGITA